MIDGLKPYPAMKDSGLRWVGKVPEHWSLTPNRSMLRRRKVLVGNRHPNYTLLSLTKAGVVIRDVSTGRGKFSADMGTSQEVRGGDLVFCLFDVPETPRTVGLSRHNGMITGAYSVFECDDPDLVRFLETFYIAMDDSKALSPLYSGLRNTIPPSRFLGTKTPIPPKDEQTAIVRFLDHADRRIQRYVRAKQKLIALLEEQKQAVIQQAVTGRIDVRTGRPYPAYDDSGVEWLGCVPAHWDLRPAKWYFREVDERSETGSEELLSVSHITGVTPRSEKNVTMFKAESNVGHKLCRPGDLVVNTMWAWMAALGVSRQVGIVSPSYAVYRPHPSSRLLGDYADLLLRTTTYKNEYICRSTGIRSSRLRLYPEQFLRIKLLCPSPEEQRAIIEFASNKSANVRWSIDLTHGEISLLREYRTRLIADVVTGKLDVREAAAALPVVDPLAEEDVDDTIHAEADSNLEEHAAVKEVIL